MKARIDKDEWYPFFTLDKDSRWGVEIEVTEDDYARYLEFEIELYKWQAKLDNLYHKHKGIQQ